jgi:hypothetical protein
MPLPTAAPVKDPYQSTFLSVDARERTNLRRNLRRQQQMSQAVLIIVKNSFGYFQTSITYQSTHATHPRGFGRLGWGFLLDNNLLWRRLIYRTCILTVRLRWPWVSPLWWSIIDGLVRGRGAAMIWHRSGDW